MPHYVKPIIQAYSDKYKPSDWNLKLLYDLFRRNIVSKKLSMLADDADAPWG